jgi:hypothetical protein
MSHPRSILASLALALIVAACAGGAPSQTPTSSASAGASGARCATAPTPPETPGWDTASQTPTVFPVIATNRVVCGDARLMFVFVDDQNRVVSAPDRTVSAAFYDLGKDPATPVATADGTFVWTIPDERGMYVFNVNLPEAGRWGAEFTTAAAGAAAEKIRYTFDVLDSTPTVQVGDPAPASKTPTLADVGGDASKISTDAHPDPAFYRTSVADALAAHKPFILVFATPKFCVSSQCGPTLDKIKPLIAANPDVTFINVEPYQLELVDGQLQPIRDTAGGLQTGATTDEWGLTAEPWIFAVDRDGVVRKSYEIFASDAEMDAAIQAIAPGG